MLKKFDDRNASSTRFKDLGYRQDAPGCWRFVDRATGASIGPQFPTRSELLADAERFAKLFGAQA